MCRLLTECMYDVDSQKLCYKYKKSEHHVGCWRWRKEINHCDDLDIQKANREKYKNN